MDKPEDQASSKQTNTFYDIICISVYLNPSDANIPKMGTYF